jgi:hypothetical protein
MPRPPRPSRRTRRACSRLAAHARLSRRVTGARRVRVRRHWPSRHRRRRARVRRATAPRRPRAPSRCTALATRSHPLRGALSRIRAALNARAFPRLVSALACAGGCCPAARLAPLAAAHADLTTAADARRALACVPAFACAQRGACARACPRAGGAAAAGGARARAAAAVLRAPAALRGSALAAGGSTARVRSARFHALRCFVPCAEASLPRHVSARCELLLPRVAPAERWWGGCVARGCEQPYGEDTHLWTLALGCVALAPC